MEIYLFNILHRLCDSNKLEILFSNNKSQGQTSATKVAKLSGTQAAWSKKNQLGDIAQMATATNQG